MWTHALLLLLSPALIGTGEAAPLGFGRLDTAVSKCSMVKADQAIPCQRLQFTQSDITGLRIRFIGTSPEAKGITHRLTFLTGASTKEQALECNSGRCRLTRSDWKGEIFSAAWGSFDDRGLPLGMPNSRTGRGHCRLVGKKLSCESQFRDGLTLSAEARL